MQERRKTYQTSREELREVIEEALEKHKDDPHHAYVQLLIDRRKKRMEMSQKFAQSFIGGLALGLLGFLGWLGLLIIEWVRTGVHH